MAKLKPSKILRRLHGAPSLDDLRAIRDGHQRPLNAAARHLGGGRVTREVLRQIATGQEEARKAAEAERARKAAEDMASVADVLRAGRAAAARRAGTTP